MERVRKEINCILYPIVSASVCGKTWQDQGGRKVDCACTFMECKNILFYFR